MIKKIVLLAPGNNVHSINVSSCLLRLGYQVHLLSLHSFIDGYSNEIIKVKIPYSLPIGYFTSFKFINEYCRRNSISILNAHYATGYGLLGSLSSFKYKALSVWGSDIYLFPKKSIIHQFLIKFILKKYNNILSTSKNMAMEISKYHKSYVYITPFAVSNIFLEDKKSQCKGENNSEFILGSTKNFELKYGVDLIVETYAKLVERTTIPTRLVLVGDGQEYETLKTRVEQLGLTGSVDFLGRMTHENMVKVLDSLDLYLIFSRSESYGVSALEASSRGIPILSSNVGGLPEVVDNFVTGELFDIQDIDLAVDKIIDIIHDEKKRERYSTNGPIFVNEFYSKRTMDISFEKALTFNDNGH